MKPETALELVVGDVVMLYRGFINADAGTFAIIYELYTDFTNSEFNGVSIITEKGEDLGGFSFSDQVEYLEFIRHTDLQYNFISCMKLADDFRKGVFKQYLNDRDKG